MAFQFVPPFEEGDKQTNNETGVEYIFTDGAWRPLGPKIEDQFDELDERYATKDYVDDAIKNIPETDLSGYLPLSGGTLTDMLKFNKGDKSADQFKIIPNSSDFHTNIYTTGNGQIRFRTSHTGLHSDNVGSHIVLDPNDGVPETKIYNVVETNSTGAVPRSYITDNYLPLGGGTMSGDIAMNGHTVSGLATPTMGAQAATKAYVDDLAGSPNFRWVRVDRSVGAENLSIGEFFISSNGNIYLHSKTKDNIDLSVDSSAVSVTGMKQLCSVHKNNGVSVYCITMSEITFNGGANNYIRIVKSAIHTSDYTSVEQICRINIPGFTF